MYAFPNYSEFYQKPLVPIENFDLLTGTNHTLATHWLIATEGFEAKNGNKIEHWKVYVFFANDQGKFDYLNPYFHSSPITSIHEAFEFAKEIESKCKCGQFDLSTSNEKVV